jgi:hypothetical protein
MHTDAAIEIELSKKLSIFGQIGYHLVKGAQVQPVFKTSPPPSDSALFVDPAGIYLSGLAVMFGFGLRMPW